LKRTSAWERVVKVIGGELFDELPDIINEDYAMSFITQAGKYKGTSRQFPRALCQVLERLK